MSTEYITCSRLGGCYSLCLSKCTTCLHTVQRESKSEYLPRACVQMCRTFITPNTGLWSRVLAVTRHDDHRTKELSQREPKSICSSVDTVLCLGTIVHLHDYRRNILLRTGRLQTADWPHTVFDSMQWIADILCSSIQSPFTECLAISYIPDGKAHFCLFCDHGKYSHITESVNYRAFCSVAFGEQDLTIMWYSIR